jgi:hypothetical protein
MVKLKLENSEKIKLQKGNKIIERPYIDYQANKKVWEFRGFKPVKDVVKENNTKEVDKTFENESKVVELKKKKRTRKKKDV